MNALVAAPLVEILRELAEQLGRVADGLESTAKEEPMVVLAGVSADVVGRLLTMRAGLVGVDQPSGAPEEFVDGKIEGLEVAIAMLGGKVPKERRRARGDTAGTSDAPKQSNANHLEVSPGRALVEERILSVLASRQGQDTPDGELAVRTVYRLSGSFTAALGKLRAEGLLEGSGNENRITMAGLTWAPIGLCPVVLLREAWRRKLKTATNAILDYLLETPTIVRSAEEIAEACGYQLSGSFTAAIAELVRLELVDRRAVNRYEASRLLR